jgi:hypothetical protein
MSIYGQINVPKLLDIPNETFQTFTFYMQLPLHRGADTSPTYIRFIVLRKTCDIHVSKLKFIQYITNFGHGQKFLYF